MTRERRSPDTGNPGGAKSAEAANLNTHSSIDKRPTVRYQATDQDQPSHVPLGTREIEMVRALRRGPCTRVELARIRPRLGLTGPATIQRLRRKGFLIESVWHEVDDSEGVTVRFVSYHLVGKVEVAT